MSDKTGDLMDLIQRKSGGFVVAERKGHQVTTNHSHYKAVTNWESLSNFTDFSEKETPDLGALKTRSDGPQMSPEQREEKIQNPIAKCTEGDKSDELKCVIEEETRAISKPKIEPREDFWISIIRFLNGQTNFNVWKYLFIFSLSLIVYNFLNGGVVATVSSFDS